MIEHHAASVQVPDRRSTTRALASVPVASSTPTVRSVSTPRRKPLDRAARFGARAWAIGRDPEYRTRALLLLVLAGALAAFAHVAEDYLTGDPLVLWDVEFSAWLHAHTSTTLLSFFELVTWAGNVAFLAALTLATAAYLVRRRALRGAALVCAVALGIEILNALLKLAFHRPRPEVAYVHLDTYSFPSGHAAGSAAIYGAMAFLLAARTSRRLAAALWIGYVLLVAGVGFSRLYLEVHYLSDVLAGTSLGIAWASACLFVYERRRSRDAALR